MMLDLLVDEVLSHFPSAKSKVNLRLLETINDAARMGHHKRLVAAINDMKNKELMNYLVNLSFDEPDGTSVTPLTMAAMTGNVALTKTLLNKYRIDIEFECNVIFDGMVVYGATALWVASGMGHLQVVKLLVEHGANVNHNTKAQSSPLRAACYEGRLEIVHYLIEHGAKVNMANKYNNTSIMIAAYKGHVAVVDALLKHGADPNKQALCGASALHYAAECGNVEVCSLLLDNGACLLPNEHNATPVLHAAERAHEEVVEMFIERPGLLSKEEIINVLELLGASFANEKVNKAYNYLMRAMEMRYSDADNIIRKQLIAPVPAYDDWFETENIPELKAIRLNHHSIHMEALTIRERILGKYHPELTQPIFYRGAVMADHGRFAQCQTLWNYAIDLRMVNNISVERDLLRFAQLFSQILRMENQELDLSIVLSVLVKCQQEIENNKYKIQHPSAKDVPAMIADQNEQNVITALYIIKIITKLCGRGKRIERPLCTEIYNVIAKLINSDTRLPDGQTLLHLAVNGITPVDDFYTNEICKFPCYWTTALLVSCGASTTALTNERNTPLHTLVSTLMFHAEGHHDFLSEAEKIIKLFADTNAHFDAVNVEGLTAAKMAKIPGVSNLLLNYQHKKTTLKCLAARCIAFHRLQYHGMVPTVLESFVQMHSADKICD